VQLGRSAGQSVRKEPGQPVAGAAVVAACVCLVAALGCYEIPPRAPKQVRAEGLQAEHQLARAVGAADRAFVGTVLGCENDPLPNTSLVEDFSWITFRQEEVLAGGPLASREVVYCSSHWCPPWIARDPNRPFGLLDRNYFFGFPRHIVLERYYSWAPKGRALISLADATEENVALAKEAVVQDLLPSWVAPVALPPKSEWARWYASYQKDETVDVELRITAFGDVARADVGKTAYEDMPRELETWLETKAAFSPALESGRPRPVRCLARISFVAKQPTITILPPKRGGSRAPSEND